jgi:hypothetical protein
MTPSDAVVVPTEAGPLRLQRDRLRVERRWFTPGTPIPGSAHRATQESLHLRLDDAATAVVLGATDGLGGPPSGFTRGWLADQRATSIGTWASDLVALPRALARRT